MGGRDDDEEPPAAQGPARRQRHHRRYQPWLPDHQASAQGDDNAKLALPHKRLRAVKAIVADVVGLTPLDRRLVEMLRVGKEKRALKLANKRLGNIVTAKKRRARMEDYIRSSAKK